MIEWTEKRFVAGRDAEGIRVDIYIAEVSGYSRRVIKNAIKDGGLTVNANVVKRPSYVLKPGQEIVIRLPEVQMTKITPRHIPIEILHADDDIIVVNKPAGLLCQPSKYEKGYTLVNALLDRFGDLPSLETEETAGLVHRLDRDVSGVVLCGRTEFALRALYKQFKARQVYKEYHAVVEGRVRPEEIKISKPLKLYKKLWRTRVSKKGKGALSIVKVIKRANDFSYVKVVPITGRTHQIRVHLASIGHPVVCDKVYGIRKELKNEKGVVILSRPALHAYKIRFKHPRTGKGLEFCAPIPQDLKICLQYLSLQK